MVAAGQNLKRLIKHKSNELYFLFKEIHLAFKVLPYTYFFNTLDYYATYIYDIVNQEPQEDFNG